MGCCLGDFVQANVTGVDFTKRTVQTDAGDVTYDYLAIAIGGRTNFFDTPGAEKFACELKTIKHATVIRNRALRLLEKAAGEIRPEERKKLLRWVVIGGGPTGVELSVELVELAESYARTTPRFPLDELEVCLYQSRDRLLPQSHERMQIEALRVLREHKIHVQLNSRIKEMDEQGVVTAEGKRHDAELVVWAAGIAPQHLQTVPEHALDERGRCPVGSRLRMEEFPEVYVVGDIAVTEGCPQTAQAAVTMGTHAGENIYRSLVGQELKQYKFRSKGDLVSLGQWQAAGMVGRFFVRGPLAWWLWRTIYLFKLVGVPNRIRVAVDWTLNLFYPRDISEM